MNFFLANPEPGYCLIDAGDGKRYENWGGVLVSRPDPSVIWPARKNNWKPSLIHIRASNGSGQWQNKPDKSWKAQIGEYNFIIRPTDFKHMGVFPEQEANWRFIKGALKKNMRVLNLFAYTGGATIAAISSGAQATHIDASKGANAWARENIIINNFEPARILTDDCRKFLKRENARGNKYDAVILDPPSYGRGPGGEIWKLETGLFDLLLAVREILSQNCAFVLINSYTTGISPIAVENVARAAFEGLRFSYESGYLALPILNSDLVLPAGCSVRIIAL